MLKMFVAGVGAFAIASTAAAADISGAGATFPAPVYAKWAEAYKAQTGVGLYPVSNFPVLGGQYFSRVGKKLRIRLFGRITTAATPGNGSFAIYYGTGADANGVLLASSGALALTASQTNLSWQVDVFVHCRSIGNAGTLFVTGKAHFNVAVLASTL